MGKTMSKKIQQCNVFQAPDPDSYDSTHSNLVFIPPEPITDSMVNIAKILSKSPQNIVPKYKPKPRGNTAKNPNLTKIGRQPGYIPCQFFECKEVSDTLLIFWHGRDGDIGSARTKFKKISDKMQTHVLYVEYPGYGIYGDGIASNTTLLSDARSVYKYITKICGVSEQQIILCGNSQGCCPTLRIAALYLPKAVISLSAFLNVTEVIQQNVIFFVINS